MKNITGIRLKKKGFKLNKKGIEKYSKIFYTLKKNGKAIRIHLDDYKVHYTIYTKETENDCDWIFDTLKNMADVERVVKLELGLDISKPKKTKAPKTIKEAVEHQQPKKELPSKWEDIVLKDYGKTNLEWIQEDSNIAIGDNTMKGYLSNDDINVLPKGLGSPTLAMCQLLLLRDIYRQGWKPSRAKTRYAIYYWENDIKEINIEDTINLIWSFQDAQTRDLFLENFKDLLTEYYKLYD